MKKLGILLLCCFLLFGLTACKETETEEKKEENTVESIMAKGNYVIVDVRTKEEYEESHVKEAINIPYDEIDENTDLPKEKTIFVYCKSGRRSGIAKESLEKLGYNVIDLGAFDSITLEKE